MADRGTSLRLQDLMTRGGTFRWLWVRHDEVAAMKATDTRVWSKLARICNSSGMAVTRDSLRNAWRSVDAEWEAAPSELRSVRLYEERSVAVDVVKKLKPAPIGAAVRPRPDFSPPAPPDDDDDPVTDMAGNVV